MSAAPLVSLARRLADGNRWLLLAVGALLLAATVLPSTTGAARSQRLLDLASGPRSPEQQVAPLDPVGPAPPALVPLLRDRLPVGSELLPSLPADDPTPTEAGSPGAVAAEPCASAAIVDTVAAAQAGLESATGQALSVDVAQLFANLAGCGAGGNPLDALGVVAQLLEALGVDRIPLPVLPALPLPPPPPGLDALGPAVLPVCAEVIQQLVTVAALAPFARMDTREVVALFDPVISVCSLFAPVA